MNSFIKLVSASLAVSTNVVLLVAPSFSQMKEFPNSVIAQGYYDSCPKAEPVRIYETRNYWVSICRAMDNTLFYRGVNKRDRNNAINLDDVLVANKMTYRIRNLPARTFYDISPKALIVTKNNRVILKEPVIRIVF